VCNVVQRIPRNAVSVGIERPERGSRPRFSRIGCDQAMTGIRFVEEPPVVIGRRPPAGRSFRMPSLASFAILERPSPGLERNHPIASPETRSCAAGGNSPRIIHPGIRMRFITVPFVPLWQPAPRCHTTVHGFEPRLEWHNHGPCGHIVRYRPWRPAVSMEFPE
jgi:hypothetical protein